ncbi:uncharacterized protein LOC126976169 [Leptidea sinapis]|uniref:uncharacterized protein LOC126976169 n=1 Tax=Leptidea sinapis TaxID=189913 RepID=UPI0021422FB7|nr:uncharacterized protein LOC126976169 [Leptidea sinapis]
MAAKSPTTSVKSREIIGGDQFSQRREVFEKYDTVFMPLPSPASPIPTYREVEPIITSNHGKTTTNFKRNTTGYSSMRESRNDERNHHDFRPRKYSDNFTSDLNSSDDVDYRYSTVERTRRLSKLRRDFLNSNIHEPNASPLARSGVRASMPANSGTVKYKIESPKIYKFPFAEPYLTPTPVRRVIVDLGPIDDYNGKENQNPEDENKHRSLPNDNGSPKIDHQKLFEELVKRYSPQRKPVDWTIPPTRPKIVGSVPKSTSSGENIIGQRDSPEKDEVFEKNEETVKLDQNNSHEINPHVEVLHNGNDKSLEYQRKNSDDKDEEREETDHVPELSPIKRQLSNSSRGVPMDKKLDLTMPELIDKMIEEGGSTNNKSTNKKVKRKRSFLDKLLGRNKGVKTQN